MRSRIEQKAKRAAELTAVLPLLQEIAEQQVSCDRMRRVLASLQQEYQAQTEMVEQVTARYRSLQREGERKKTAISSQQERVKAVQQRLDEMEPALRELNVLDGQAMSSCLPWTSN